MHCCYAKSDLRRNGELPQCSCPAKRYHAKRPPLCGFVQTPQCLASRDRDLVRHQRGASAKLWETAGRSRLTPCDYSRPWEPQPAPPTAKSSNARELLPLLEGVGPLLSPFHRRRLPQEEDLHTSACVAGNDAPRIDERGHLAVRLLPVPLVGRLTPESRRRRPYRRAGFCILRAIPLTPCWARARRRQDRREMVEHLRRYYANGQ